MQPPAEAQHQPLLGGEYAQPQQIPPPGPYAAAGPTPVMLLPPKPHMSTMRVCCFCTMVVFMFVAIVLAALALSSSQTWWKVEGKLNGVTLTSFTMYIDQFELCPLTVSSCSTNSYSSANLSNMESLMSRTQDLSRAGLAFSIISIVLLLAAIFLSREPGRRASGVMLFWFGIIHSLDLVLLSASAVNFATKVGYAYCSDMKNVPSAPQCEGSDTSFIGSSDYNNVNLNWGPGQGWNFEAGALVWVFVVWCIGFPLTLAVSRDARRQEMMKSYGGAPYTYQPAYAASPQQLYYAQAGYALPGQSTVAPYYAQPRPEQQQQQQPYQPHPYQQQQQQQQQGYPPYQ